MRENLREERSGGKGEEKRQKQKGYDMGERRREKKIKVREKKGRSR